MIGNGLDWIGGALLVIFVSMVEVGGYLVKILNPIVQTWLLWRILKAIKGRVRL